MAKTDWKAGDKLTADEINKLNTEVAANTAKPAGTKGDPGKEGAPGKSAYDLAKDAGFEGDQAAWLASLKGAKGDPGKDGAPGKQGDPGKDGAPGKDAAAQFTEEEVTKIKALITDPPAEG